MKVARVVPPVACTSAADVRVYALEPAMELQTRAREELRLYAAMWARATDPVMRELVARAVREAKARGEIIAGVAGWLDGPVGALEHAEATRNWDRLAGLSGFTSGRAIAGELIPLLDTIRAADGVPRVGEIAAARAALDVWFEQLGAEVVRDVVLREVGRVLRAPTLLREYERWARFGRTA